MTLLSVILFLVQQKYRELLFEVLIIHICFENTN